MRSIDTIRFNRWCTIAALVFLLLTIGAKTAWYEYRGLPQTQDYPQYYMAGLIARMGAWDSLYPIPKPGADFNPGAIEDSILRPRYRELAIEYGVGEYTVRYMQPPPLALLFIPLSLLPYKLSFYLWVLLLILAAWGISMQAGKIYAICLGHTTKMVGIIILIVAISPQAHRWVRVGNMSVLLGWLIGFSTIAMLKRDSVRVAALMVVGTVAKYAPAVLGPMFIVLRRWRTIAWGVIMLAAWLIVSYVIIGPEPFRTFFTEISPTLTRTVTVGENQSLYPTLIRMLGIERPPLPRPLEWIFSIARALALLVILGLIFLKPRRFWDRPEHVFAGALALLGWLLIFSPITWEHYHAYLAPFWGWLAYQGTKSRARAVFAVLGIGLAYLPTSLLFRQLSGGAVQLPEPLYSHLFCALVIQLGLAVWVLLPWANVQHGSHS